MIGFVSLSQELTDMPFTLVLSQLLDKAKTVYNCCVCQVSGVQHKKIISCSPRKVEQYKDFPQHKQHYDTANKDGCIHTVTDW